MKIAYAHLLKKRAFTRRDTTFEPRLYSPGLKSLHLGLHSGMTLFFNKWATQSVNKIGNKRS